MLSAFVIVNAVAAVILLLQFVSIPDIAGSYSVHCHRNYPYIEQSTLYDFVMLPDVANKWMKFVTFVATDHKPIGIGKTYKVAIGAQAFSFVTAEHQQGQYIVLQNTNQNDILNLRVEIRFHTVLCVPRQFEEKPIIHKSLDLHSIHRIEKIGTNVSQMQRTLNNTASEVQHDHKLRDLFPTGKCGSELSFKLFSLHDSLLFQNTIGVLVRYFLRLRLEHSLTNLAHILLHVER